jgi:uncharacterized protein YyaL (SSP411 family)
LQLCAGDDAKFSRLPIRFAALAFAVYQPSKIVPGNAGPVELFARTLPVKGGTVVYLCTGNLCQPPASEAEKVKGLLK